LAGLFNRLVGRIFDLTSHFEDGGDYVISHRKVLQLERAHAASAGRICSSVRQILLALLSTVPDPCAFAFVV